ncbi:MAG: 2-amino-4-hydroxy-6-hydroxymethyldihydropteridine diphosphokinase [Lysobacteraceae bacterium]|nr:MAG: 2-amino-4-hydroxy-6-hydroxymethyldihydropteridine diphosphokinase [Xanthomonadaceae bacterium]
MGKAYLSLGSNVRPEQNLASALQSLRQRFGPMTVSPAYRTTAIGFEGPDFLNAAAVIDSDLDVHALNAWLHALEDAQGRDRNGPRFGDRPLDIDIVFYDDLVTQGAGNLRVPRPELKHAFVLKPLVDIAPGFVDPVSGCTLAELWAQSPERRLPLTIAELRGGD